MLQFHRLSSFWQEDFQRFNQSEHIIVPGSHVGFLIFTKIKNLVEDLPMNISAKIGPNLFSGFREEYEKFTDMDDDDDDDDDAKWWQKLTWPFGPGELKKGGVVIPYHKRLLCRPVHHRKIDWLILLIDLLCFSATFSNISAISWRPVLVVEEAGVPGENHRPWASNW